MPGQHYQFERWTLDCGRLTLVDGAGEIALRPKSFEVLRILIENAGRLVPREGLLGAVWPDVTVSEESLTQCISEIRGVLDGSGARIIKTVPKRGYVFTVPVTYAAASAVAPAEASAIDGPSVAVLPFANLSSDAGQDYLSDGITEDIINGLSYFSGLSVIARASSFSYKGQSADVRVVGQQLGVRYVVQGSVRRFGDRIRINAQLADARTGLQRWAERFDRALGDVFAVQDEITHAIVRIVVAHIGPAEEERAARKPPSSWSAYDLMLRGDQAWRVLEQTWVPLHLHEAHRLWQEAHAADPSSAMICAKLALSFVRAHADPANPECGDAAMLAQGYEMAMGAVSLDPNLPFARARLGWAYFWMNELDAAIREFENALALNPNFSDVHFPAVLNFSGDPARALGMLQAQARLDPFHPPQLHAVQGHSLYVLRRYQDALVPLTESIRRGPQGVLGHVWLAATLVRLGRGDEARRLMTGLRERVPHLTLARWRIFTLYRDRADSEHMIEALNAAGLF